MEQFEWAGIIADCCALAALAVVMKGAFYKHHELFKLLAHRDAKRMGSLTRHNLYPVTYKRNWIQELTRYKGFYLTLRAFAGRPLTLPLAK